MQLDAAAGTPTDTPSRELAEEVLAALRRPSFYPGHVDRVEVHETHISWVFLAGDRALKLKKPLVLPFLDYGTASRRRQMCREEVRVNRRLAPDVYLGVRSVAATGDGLTLAEADDPRAVDYVVEMDRYDPESTLAATLTRGELTETQVVALARRLAAFHAEAPRAAAAAARRLVVERQMTDNVHELLTVVEQRPEVDWALELERFAHAFVVSRAAELEARTRRGLVREGHGDLRAEHVLLGEGIAIVDAVEFDVRLRELDVADDLGFLVMDLAALGGARYTPALVDAYRAAGGDPGDDALLAFYACHRALVRAKVALLAGAQQPAGSDARGRASVHARDLIMLAMRFAWQARMPLVIAVCGAPASGKSRLSRELAERSGLPHLSSDVTRKRLIGIAPRARATADAYAAAVNHRTYAELGRRAALAVRASGGALVDATFRHRSDRDAFATAFGGAAPVLFVECWAPAEVLLRRASERDRRAHVSDASPSVVRREIEVWEPLAEVPAEAHVTVRSDRPVEAQIADVVALLDRRLGRLGG